MKKAKAKKPAKSKQVKPAAKAAKPAKKDTRVLAKPATSKSSSGKADKKVDSKVAAKSDGKAAAKISSSKLASKAGKVAPVTKEAVKESSKETSKELGKKNPSAAPLTGKAAARAAVVAKAGTVKSPKNLTKAEKNAEVLAQLQSIADEPEIVLTNADGKQYCRVHDCDNESTTEGLCRLHYLALWKRNKVKAKILQGGKLDKYIEDLTSKYPDKYLEMLRKDLASEKDFNLIIAEMDVEDSGDDAESEDDANRFIEEVRGGVPTSDDDDPGF